MPFTAKDNSALTPKEVRTIQERLVVHGFDPGPIDGIYGPRPSSAIIAFKRSIGYRQRPFVGELTMRELMKDPASGSMIFSENPPWIDEGRKYLGMHEVYDNSELREFMSSDGKHLGDPAVFPWCGDFVETCIKLALPNEPFPGALGQNPYWALNWKLFGIESLPCLGAPFAISRNGGGHAGFLVGEDEHRYYSLGGNQSNRVSIAPILKSRFDHDSIRWPSTYSGPKLALPRYHSTASAESNFA